MKSAITIISILYIAFTANAQHSYQPLDSANTYYSNGNFEKAIQLYEQVLSEGVHSSELYYNLGNAYYKSNKYPMAIVNYERALKLSPGDSDIAFNLEMANMNIIDKLEVMPEFFLSNWRYKFNHLLSSNIWALISIALFVSGLLLLLVFFFSRISVIRKATFWIGILFIGSFFVSFNASRKMKWYAEKEPEAIIITPSVVVKSAPNAAGTELFIIHEGLKIKVVDQLDDWRRIRLSDGNKGWLKVSDLVVI